MEFIKTTIREYLNEMFDKSLHLKEMFMVTMKIIVK